MASVHQHRNRWRVKWRDSTGRQLVESFDTEKAARDAARRIEAQTVIDGKAPIVTDPEALTLTKWWDRWEPGNAWRASTRSTHGTHWTKWIQPVFGRMPLDNITTADVRQFHRHLEARGLAPRTVGSIHRTLSMALEAAVADGFLGRNPARTAKLPRKAKTAPVALDAATTRRMLDAIAATAPGLAVYAELVAATGLRRAEAAGLTWDRVDLDGGVITVDRQLDYSASTLPAWSDTKTTGVRRVVIAPATVNLLRRHRSGQEVTRLDRAGLVFTQPDGTPWPRSTLADAWRRAKRILADDGHPLPDGARGWHTLRHGAASRLLEQGVPPAEAAQHLGHSVEVLLGTYAHISNQAEADARIRAAISL